MNAAEVIIVLIVAVIAAYALSLLFHPWRPCRVCKGTGKHKDPLWLYAHGDCPACKGHPGRQPRLGVRLLTRARARRLTGKAPRQ